MNSIKTCIALYVIKKDFPPNNGWSTKHLRSSVPPWSSMDKLMVCPHTDVGEILLKKYKQRNCVIFHASPTIMSISTPLIWWLWLVLRKHWEEYPTCFYSRLSALTVKGPFAYRIYTDLIDLCWIGLLDKIHEIVRVEPHPLTANAYYQREICHFAQEHTRSYNKLCRLPLYFWTSCDEPRGVTRKFSWGASWAKQFHGVGRVGPPQHVIP